MSYRAIAEYYDAEYASADLLQRDVPFFMEQLPRRRLRILDLATGTGRAAIPLAQAGHRVVGVDYDPAMLAIARRKRDAVGLGDAELRLVRGDLMRLRLPGRFDWACIFFNTFLVLTTIDQQDRVLSGVRRRLARGGRLWIDIFHPDPALLAEAVRDNIEPELFYVESLGRSVHRTTEVRQLQSPQLQRVTFHYDWFDDDGTPRNQRLSFELTYLYPRELQLLLERNGFIVEKLWGDYNASPITRDSPRIICQARRVG